MKGQEVCYLQDHKVYINGKKKNKGSFRLACRQVQHPDPHGCAGSRCACNCVQSHTAIGSSGHAHCTDTQACLNVPQGLISHNIIYLYFWAPTTFKHRNGCQHEPIGSTLHLPINMQFSALLIQSTQCTHNHLGPHTKYMQVNFKAFIQLLECIYVISLRFYRH